MISSLKPYIVLVDDDTDYLVAARELINVRFPGHTIFMCSDPVQAIFTMHKLDGPAVFMVDYCLPDMDGITLINHIKSTFRFDCFCYLVSGHPKQHEVFVKAMKSGTLYFSKNPSVDGEPQNLGELYTSHIQYAINQLREIEFDPLTGLYTLGTFKEFWGRNFAHVKRYPKPISFLLADVNFLKVINELFEYHGGDLLLKGVGSALKKGVRNNFDMAARVGGDEFGILLPETKLKDAAHVAERVERETNAVEIVIGKAIFHASVAVGVSMIRPKDLGNDPEAAYEELFRRSEKAMKKRKLETRLEAESRLMHELGIGEEVIRDIESRRGLGEAITRNIGKGEPS